MKDSFVPSLPASAPAFRSVVGFALGLGCCRWRVRRSAAAFSGLVLVVGFGSSSAAFGFARAALPRFFPLRPLFRLVVRRFSSPAGAVWGVSVPVSPVGLSLASLPPAPAFSALPWPGSPLGSRPGVAFWSGGV